MRQPLLSTVGQQRSSQSSSKSFIPPPLRGYSAVEPAYGGNPQFATTFSDVWVDAGMVNKRPGSALWGSRAAAGSVQHLALYGSTLFAFTSNGVYDATVTGAYGAAVYAITKGRVNTVNMKNLGGAFLVCSNGQDTPFYWNGTAWAASAITNVTGGSTTLDFNWIFKRRIFFTQAGTSDAYYLPVDAIQGAAKKFPVGPLFSRGGTLLCGFNWSLDSGIGPDDYCGFVSSEGEVAVYAGTDPASAASFGLIGVYYLGKPICARCVAKIGGDVVIATQQGLFSMSEVSKGRELTPSMAISAPFGTSWSGLISSNALTSSRGSVFYYPAQSLLFVVLVSDSNTFTTLVYNTQNSSWSFLNNWEAETYVSGGILGNNTLYYGYRSGGNIIQAWNAGVSTDWTLAGGNGQAYTCNMVQVGAALGGGRDITALLVRPRVLGNFINGTFCGTTVNSAGVSSPWIMPTVTALDVQHTTFSPSFVNLTGYQGCDVLSFGMATP